MKDKKNILIGALLVVIAFMSVGYASFSQRLDIDGGASIVGDWGVEIISIEPDITGTAADGTPASSFTASTASFNAKLKKPGDSITYTITIENKGSIDAKLSSITLTPQATTANDGAGSDAILYEITSQPAKDSVLAAGAKTTVVIQITYDENVDEAPEVVTRSFTGVIEYVQA